MLAAGAVAADFPAAAANSAIARFQPPEAPLTLTRSVYRQLVDGKEIVVSRRYAIHFTRDDRGFRLDGKLIDVQVAAPPSLAMLADVERKRADVGLFPVQLGADGMIEGAMVAHVDPAVRQQLLQGGASVLTSSGMASGDLQQSKSYLGAVVNASHGASWPLFLFNPGPAEHREVRQIALGDGSSGEVEVRVKAEDILPGGVARRVERKVITRIAGTERVAREVWTIAQ